MARRLCMVVHGPYPLGEPRVAREARVALDRGYEVEVVAMAREGEPRSEWVDGLRVTRLPVTHRRGVGLLRILREYVAFTVLATRHLARRRYDVVHVHNPPDFLLVAALMPKLRGARVLFDIHDLSPDMFAMRFEGKRLSRLIERILLRIERAACRLAHAVITVHEPYRAELIGRGVAADKVHVVMNSLDERLLPSAAVPRSWESFEIVYHGTITPHYGLGLLVEAFADVAAVVPDARLSLFGEGDAVADVERRVAHFGLNDRVALTRAYLPQRDVLERIRTAAVGVVPNLPIKLNRFALSTKLFEYCLLRIPVVSADLPTIRAHFDERHLRFFVAGDRDALAEALLDVARSPADAAARAEAASAWCSRYRWEISASRYADLLEARAA